MPGKKDPEYFPINYNMSGLESFFGIGRTGGSPIVTPCGSLGSHHGKFDYEPMNMSFNVSIPPVNSEEDEETTDDDEEEETSSMTGSDIDVDMDTLVLSIRKKLKMGVKNPSSFSHHHHHQLHSSRRHSAHKQSSDEFWTDSPVSDHHHHNNIQFDDDEEDSSDNVSSNNSVMSSNNIINGSSGSNNSNNNSSSSLTNNNNGTSSNNNNMRRWRSNVQSINNHSHHRHIINGRIQKSHHHHHWWSRPNNGKKCSDNTKSASLSLLQELISSGNLISEAVKRLKQKNCFPSLSANSNSNSVKLSKKFTYNDQESENNITSCYSTPQITPI